MFNLTLNDTGGLNLANQLLARCVVAQNPVNTNQERSVIYYTHSQGKFRSNKAVLGRFYRLNWGGWIRPRAGRHKHLWQKPFHIRWWAKQHVLCTEEQCKVLDQMVSKRLKEPNYFVDDPYEPYQKRNGLAYVPMGKNSVSTSYINIINEKQWYLCENWILLESVFLNKVCRYSVIDKLSFFPYGTVITLIIVDR